MKKHLVSIVILLLFCVSFSSAFANSWGLSGPLLSFVNGDKNYDDYSANVLFYKKDVAVTAAVMNSRYHNILLVCRTDGNGKKELWTSTTAVFQPGVQADPELNCTDDTVTLTWNDSSESFTFTYDADEDDFLLTCSECGDTVLTWNNGRYITENGIIWQTGQISIRDFNISLFPCSEYDIEYMNRIYAALDNASGFWHMEVTGNDKKAAVYSAPSEASYRAAKGKAAVATTQGVYLLASEDDWCLVEYEVSFRTHRIGWIHNVSLSNYAPVMLTDIPVLSVQYITDDPFWSQYQLMNGSKLTDIHLAALANPFYAYATATTTDGKAIGGFVPVRQCSLPEEQIDQEAMSVLCGTWAFVSGGNIACDVLKLHDDGNCELFSLTDEATDTQLYLTEGLDDNMLAAEVRTGTWYVINSFVQGGTGKTLIIKVNGDVTSLDLYNYPLTVDESGRDILTLVCGEAGGSWTRIDEEDNQVSIPSFQK